MEKDAVLEILRKNSESIQELDGKRYDNDKQLREILTSMIPELSISEKGEWNEAAEYQRDFDEEWFDVEIGGIRIGSIIRYKLVTWNTKTMGIAPTPAEYWGFHLWGDDPAYEDAVYLGSTKR